MLEQRSEKWSEVRPWVENCCQVLSREAHGLTSLSESSLACCTCRQHEWLEVGDAESSRWGRWWGLHQSWCWRMGGGGEGRRGRKRGEEEGEEGEEGKEEEEGEGKEGGREEGEEEVWS